MNPAAKQPPDGLVNHRRPDSRACKGIVTVSHHLTRPGKSGVAIRRWHVAVAAAAYSLVFALLFAGYRPAALVRRTVRQLQPPFTVPLVAPG